MGLTEYDLIQLNQIAVDIEEIQENIDKGFSYLYEISIHSDFSSRYIWDIFFKGIRQDKVCLVRCDYNYGEVSGNYRIRFIVIRDNEDFVITPIKIVDPIGKDRYISIEYLPMNLSDKEINKDVLEVLKKFSCIKRITYISGERGHTKNNFYNTENDFYEWMNKSKWKSKRGINKVSEIVEVNVLRDSNIKLVSDYKYIHDIWFKFKNRSMSSSTAFDIDFKALRDINKIKDGVIIDFRYKDKIIGMVLGFTLFNDFVSIMVQRSVGITDIDFLKKYLECSDYEADILIKYLGSFIQFQIHKILISDLHFKAIYYSGDMGDPKLKYFKNIYYHNVIHYKTEMI